MPSFTDLPELIGFFSYSREDDEDSHGALTALRDSIQRELRGQLGRSMKTFRLWQDKEAIAPGTLWEAEIKTAVAQAVFFIPIITPTVIRSPYCKFELEFFLEREAELGRSDLVFPILYIRVPELEDGNRLDSDPVLSIIAKRQYLDWREFRHLDVQSTHVKATIERFCGNICDALHRSLPPDQRGTPEEITARRQIEPVAKVPLAETIGVGKAIAAQPTAVITSAPTPSSNHALIIGSLLAAAAVGAVGIWLIVAPPKPVSVTAAAPTIPTRGAMSEPTPATASLPPPPVLPAAPAAPAAPVVPMAPVRQSMQIPPPVPLLQSAGGFMFPDSDRRYLTRNELESLSPADLRIARNEIFARKGRYFRDPQLAAYFAKFSWYRPYSYDVSLNNIEQANVSLIQSVEH